MKYADIRFSPKLTDDGLLNIEEIYGVRFPLSLREFYREGISSTDVKLEFPRWDDFSPDNVGFIKAWMHSPAEQLLDYLKSDPEYLAWAVDRKIGMTQSGHIAKLQVLRQLLFRFTGTAISR